MGINDDAFSLVEANSKDDVSGFASCAGDGDELGQGLGDLATEIRNEFARSSLERLGLVVKETGSADERFKLRQGCLGHGRRSGEAAEELGGDHVHAHVGALGGENSGDEKLEGRGVVESALDVGVGFVEDF